MDIDELSQQVDRISQKYAETFGIERDAAWFLLKLQEEIGELTQAYLMLSGGARAKGKSAEEMQADFQREAADVFCHVLLLAKFHNIDLEKEIGEKWLVWSDKSLTT